MASQLANALRGTKHCWGVSKHNNIVISNDWTAGRGIIAGNDIASSVEKYKWLKIAHN